MAKVEANYIIVNTHVKLNVKFILQKVLNVPALAKPPVQYTVQDCNNDNTLPRHSGVFMRSTAMQTGSTNFRDRGHRTTQEDKSFLFNSISYSQNIVK